MTPERNRGDDPRHGDGMGLGITILFVAVILGTAVLVALLA